MDRYFFDVKNRAPAGVERVASVEGVTEHRLANGLRAVLVPDPVEVDDDGLRDVPWPGRGTRTTAETGMAHLIEHLVSYGSPKHPDAKRSNRNTARGAMQPHRSTARTTTRPSRPPTPTPTGAPSPGRPHDQRARPREGHPRQPDDGLGQRNEAATTPAPRPARHGHDDRAQLRQEHDRRDPHVQ